MHKEFLIREHGAEAARQLAVSERKKQLDEVRSRD